MKPKNKLREGRDYLLLPDKDDDQAYVVRVVTGPFEGMMYRYYSVQIEERGDEANLKYTTDIVEGAVPDTTYSEFHQLTADILHSIIENFLDSDPEAIKFEDEDGRELGNYSPPTLG